HADRLEEHATERRESRPAEPHQAAPDARGHPDRVAPPDGRFEERHRNLTILIRICVPEWVVVGLEQAERYVERSSPRPRRHRSTQTSRSQDPERLAASALGRRIRLIAKADQLPLEFRSLKDTRSAQLIDPAPELCMCR